MQAQRLYNTCSMVHLHDISYRDFKGNWRKNLKHLNVDKTAIFVTNFNFWERLKYFPFAVKKIHTYLGAGGGNAHICVVDVRTPMERLNIWLTS